MNPVHLLLIIGTIISFTGIDNAIVECAIKKTRCGSELVIMSREVDKGVYHAVDTFCARVLWTKDFTTCLLLYVVPSHNPSDTSVLISGKGEIVNDGDRLKIHAGGTYEFIVEKDTPLGSPTKRISVSYRNTVVWTNKEPYKMKPQLCLNCTGEYVTSFP